MRVAVTGANGFLGTHIVERLRAQEIAVVSLVRSITQGTSERLFTLGESPSSEILSGVEVLVHSAYDFSSRDAEHIHRINVKGSQQLFAAAQAAGVKKIIFISSMAAFEGTPSRYGQGKLEVEKTVTAIPGGVSIRPGSIWSEAPRGLMGTLKKLASLPIVPYFAGRDLSLFLVHVDDVARIVLELVQDRRVIPSSRVISCAALKPVPFKEILKRLSGRTSPLMFPVPARIVHGGLRMMEAMGIRPPFASDSLIGLMNANKHPENLISSGLREI